MLGQISLFQSEPSQSIRQRVKVERVELRDVRYILEKLHYLKRVRKGKQINYAVFLDSKVDGVITFAHPMVSVPIADVPSDEIIEFGRLYLYTRTPLVASCAIGKVLKRVKKDWMKRYPTSKVPQMVVSWSDVEVHKGTIYKASNFIHYKRTKGGTHSNLLSSKRGFRYKHDDYKHDKDCWLYPLNAKVKKHIKEIMQNG